MKDRPTHLFRAIWPITDDNPTTYGQLMAEAAGELPMILAQTAAQLTAPGKFSIAPSVLVPGSGRVTETVLLYEGPAIQRPRRPYRS